MPSPSQPTHSDRFLAAGFAIVIMGLMVTALPLALGVLTRGYTLVAVATYVPLGHGGSSAIVAASAITAYLLGTERTFVLFGHLWGTEQPRKLWLTLFLWAELLVVGLLGNRILR